MTAPTGMRRWKLGKVFEYVFYALLLVFLALYLRSIDFATLRELEPAWWSLGVATVLALTFRYWGAFIWTTLLRSLGARNVRMSPELVDVYARSWLGRYIPGTAPWILGKIYFASAHGVSKATLGVSSLLEAALQIIVQLLFALVLLLSDPRAAVLPGEVRAGFVVAIVLCFVALVPRVFNAVVGLVYRVLLRRPLDPSHRVGLPTVAKGFGLYAAGAVIAGLSLFFVAKAVHVELPWSQVFFVMGASSLAGAVSMLAVFAPGGIGVREGVQIALLSVVMPTEFALVVAVATRLHSVLVDLAFYGAARTVLIRARRRRRTSAAGTTDTPDAPASPSGAH